MLLLRWHNLGLEILKLNKLEKDMSRYIPGPIEQVEFVEYFWKEKNQIC